MRPGTDIQFRPGFDRRHAEPAQNYGIGGVLILFTMQTARGAVSFELITNWMPPSVWEEWGKTCRGTCRPIGGLTYHSPEPREDAWPAAAGDCPLLGDRVCYSLKSYTRADRTFEALLAGGLDALWEDLEAFEQEVIGEASP